MSSWRGRHPRVCLIFRTLLVMLGSVMSAGSAEVSDDKRQESETFTETQLEFFEKKIRPVLVRECYGCHSAEAEKLQGGLFLDSRAGLLEGGDSGAAVVPGKPDESLLIEALRHESFEMPPDKRLPDATVRDFESWIRTGLADPRSRPQDAQKKRRVLYTEKDAEAHWAFQPVSNPTVPELQDDWVRTPIDAFVLARLKDAGLSPSPRADGRTLIRRAFYNLTGLPPSFQQVQRFEEEPSPEAFLQIVDRLLKSPRYGEHWGRHWLDIARYADTNGQRPAPTPDPPFYPFAWVYRDYVIDAFNNDLPFDEFIIEQLAGDLIPGEEGRHKLAGVGFLRVGRSFGQNVDDRIDDRIDTVTKAFLGLTVSCARCHDHKLDPVFQEDYYALHGVFRSSDDVEPVLHDTQGTREYADFLRQREVLVREIEDECLAGLNDFMHGLAMQTADYMIAAERYRDGQLKEKLPKLAALEVKLKAIPFGAWLNAMDRWEAQDTPAWRPWFALASLSREEFTQVAPRLVKQIASGAVHGKTVPPTVARLFVDAKIDSLEDVADLYQSLFLMIERESDRQYPMASLLCAMKESPGLFRDEYYSHPALPPPLKDADLEALRQVTIGFEGPFFMTPRELMQAGAAGPRKAMVRRMHEVDRLGAVHPGAPVRVMTMRDKAQPEDSPIFIRGDSQSPGKIVPRRFLRRLSHVWPEPFSHGSGRLELAQAIAAEENPLTARVIVNRVWQWHFGTGLVTTPSDFGLNGQRPSHPELLDWLAAWFVREDWSIGKLHRLIMDSSVYQQASFPRPDGMEIDAENSLLWRFSPRRMTFEEIRDTWLTVAGTLRHQIGGRPAELAAADCRSIYLSIDRYDLPEFFNTFDFANPDFSTAERDSTTVPQQSLYMMNSPWLIDRANELASRDDVITLADRDARLQRLFEIAYQRHPDGTELSLLTSFLDRFPASQQEMAFRQLVHALLQSSEMIHVR